MRRAPFPYNITLGTDISNARRILNWSNPARFEHNAHGLSLLKRVLHKHDFVQLQRRFPWWQRPSAQPEANVRRLSFFLAGRWAAKEAAKKAWRADLLGWRDLAVAGPPEIVCRVEDAPWDFDADELVDLASEEDANVMVEQETDMAAAAAVDEQVARLSISHDGEYAVATVLATPLHADILAALEQRQAKVDLRMQRTRPVQERANVKAG
ncbi:hypothetical protein DV735_g3454, partial [Chaetothyriales sp. CBS 134920]